MTISEELMDEARAFDHQIDERIRNGHIPDLRRVQPCDWFYNNPWRRPHSVELVLGREFQFALRHARRPRLLEVGCGPGHFSLEFARHGYAVTGLDISSHSIDIANQMLAKNPFRENFGSLSYVNADLFSLQIPPNSFETVCFFGTLHHFTDPDLVLAEVARILAPNGVVLALEPVRDGITIADASLTALMRLLLSFGGHWYDSIPLARTEQELLDYVQACLTELQTSRDHDEERQSPNDNDSGSGMIIRNLRNHYREIEVQFVHGFLPRIIGGVRGVTDLEEQTLVSFLSTFDRLAVASGLIHAGEFWWAGEKP